MPSSPRAPRIGICGAGVGGLTLAGILSRTLPRARIAVFERAPADRDQGYGLDLDKHGQEALARARVYHRYWEISRPFSDSMAFFPMHGEDLLGVYFRPAMLRYLFPSFMAAQPETNRGALRDVLLDAVASNENVSVQFEADVRDIRANGAGADLLDGAGGHLGTFDLVVDAMGLHSTLRQHRVHDATDGKQPTGTTIIHGMINDPESCCGSALLGRLSRFGTVCSAGRGYTIFMQRYGAGAKDNRTSLMYYLNDVSEERLYAEMGIERPTSRATGIMKDERLDRVKEWVLRDMGNALDPTWREAVRCLDRATVRAEVTHGDTTLRDDVTLPLVCMGDSQRNAGLGGGGILAMRDALDLADVLVSNDAFDANTGSVRQPPLRMAEAAMMERKQEFHAQAVLRANRTKKSIEKHGRGEDSLADYYSGWKLGLARLLLPRLGRLTGAWYRYDEWRLGRVGSDESTIIYPNVEAVLENGVGR